MTTTRQDLSHLLKIINRNLDNQHIVSHINPKHVQNVFSLYNELLDYTEGKEYKDEELAADVIIDWYSEIFSNRNLLRTKFLIKENENEKWVRKQEEYKKQKETN